MTAKPVFERALATRDVDEAINYYRREADAGTAPAFVASLEQAYAHIERHPASGSLRYADAFDLPGLRCWALKRFPYLVFYVEEGDHIDVWRVLHSRRDIPAEFLT